MTAVGWVSLVMLAAGIVCVIYVLLRLVTEVDKLRRRAVTSEECIGRLERWQVREDERRRAVVAAMRRAPMGVDNYSE